MKWEPRPPLAAVRQPRVRRPLIRLRMGATLFLGLAIGVALPDSVSGLWLLFFGLATWCAILVFSGER